MYIYIGQIAERRTASVFAFNIQNTIKHLTRSGTDKTTGSLRKLSWILILQELPSFPKNHIHVSLATDYIDTIVDNEKFSRRRSFDVLGLWLRLTNKPIYFDCCLDSNTRAHTRSKYT